MRVYGSSPLYNYVELVFRSKRMFIICIVLATALTATVAALRAGNYTAQAIIYLTGSETTGPAVRDDTQKGSIQYKLNLLDVTTKDPKFMKDAFKDEGLDKDINGRQLTEEQFDTFCKDARTAMTFTTGLNILEISIRWPDSRADKIINSFYSAFSRRVLDEETLSNRIELDATQGHLKDYTAKQKAIEQKVIKFKLDHLHDMPQEYAQTVAELNSQKNVVKATDADLQSIKLSIAEVNRQLANTPPTIDYSQVHDTTNSALVAYQAKIEELNIEKTQLLTIYTENDPRVKKVEQNIQMLQKLVAATEKRAGIKAGGKGAVSRTTEITNPTYTRLQSQLSDLQVNVQGQEATLADAKARQDDLEKKAKASPVILENYLWMVKDLNLYTNIRDNLRARLEQAQMTDAQERELHLAEMKMVVPPTAELETVGAKTLIFYAAGPLIGLLVAFAFSLLSETLDHSLRTPVEVEKYLGKPVLAVLPRMDLPRDTPRRLLTSGGDAPHPTLPSG